LALVLSACNAKVSDGNAADSAGSAADPVPPAVEEKRKQVFADLKRVEDAISNTKRWAAKCPAIDAKEVLMTTFIGLAKVRGASHSHPQVAHEQELTPLYLAGMSANRLDYVRKEQQAALDVVGKHRHLAVLSLREYRPAELDHSKTERVSEKTGDKVIYSGTPGSMTAVVYVVDKKDGKALCALSIEAENSKMIEGGGLFGEKERDDDIRRNLAQAAADAAEKATGAKLIDETGPIAKSPRFTPKQQPKK
jgi:hypothetical protein